MLRFTHERDKKEAINSTFNKTSIQKIYSDYAKCKRKKSAKKKKKNFPCYCFQSEHMLKSYTLTSPAIRTGTQKRFITESPNMPSRVEKETNFG